MTESTTERKRTRGPTRPYFVRSGELIDRWILDTLKKGELVIGKDGNVVMDESGKPLRQPPSTAFMRMALERIKRQEDRRSDLVLPDAAPPIGTRERLQWDAEQMMQQRRASALAAFAGERDDGEA